MCPTRLSARATASAERRIGRAKLSSTMLVHALLSLGLIIRGTFLSLSVHGDHVARLIDGRRCGISFVK
jgi:hypothetical protein